jgi:hypothetical protein
MQNKSYGQVDVQPGLGESRKGRLWGDRSFPMTEGLNLRYKSGLIIETLQRNKIGDIEGSVTFPDGVKALGDFFSLPEQGPGVTALEHWVFCTKERDPVKRLVTIKEMSLRKHGMGIEEDADGLVFQGTFLCNKRWGFGKLSVDNKEFVPHYFINDFVQRRFKKVLADGREVEEMWLARPKAEQGADGKKQIGYKKEVFLKWGAIRWPDGQAYEGRIQNDQPHGLGVMSGVDGGVHRGSFSEGRRHGDGVFVGAATSIEGTWLDDRLDCQINEVETRRFDDPNNVVYFAWVSKLEQEIPTPPDV